MAKDELYLVSADILPPVVDGVLAAKELLASGKAENVSQAAKMAGISRSAFYKYRDSVFKYSGHITDVFEINAVLLDKSGVFSAITTALSNNGANILTINQSAPTDGVASATLRIKIDSDVLSIDELIQKLSSVDGVIKIKAKKQEA